MIGIDVKDRLPNDGDSILVYNGIFVREAIFYESEFIDPVEEWTVYDGIKLWAPMPELLVRSGEEK